MSKFRVGDIVAVTPDAVLRSGEIGRIDEARDEESFLPYKVRFAGGDVGWFDASELTLHDLHDNGFIRDNLHYQE